MCERSLIADSAGDAISIKLLQEWHHDSARCLEFLAQLTHCR